MSEPIAVIISDIHFTVPTLELASQSLLKAQFKAKMLDVPLIIAGDTLDSKAIMRAECVNELLRRLSVEDATPTYILCGNHDLANEKGTEHSLNFLYDWNKSVKVIDRPTVVHLGSLETMLIPYYSDVEKLKLLLQDEENPRLLIMHQGVQGAQMGHYIVDKTSLSQEVFENYRVISGHYHKAQDIKCGRPRKGAIGLFSYVGNPYTLSFGEANDPPKGYCILHDDGVLERVPLNLRKHVIIETDVDSLPSLSSEVLKEDIVWLKVSGPKSKLSKVNKAAIGQRLFGHSNFKLDLIPDQDNSSNVAPPSSDPAVLLDSMVDSVQDTLEHKIYLKGLWREIL